MSKAIILSIIARLEDGLLPSGPVPKATPRPALEARAWACAPAMSKTVVGGDKQLIVAQKLVSLKAATDEQLLSLVATYDLKFIAASMSDANAKFNKLVAGLSSTALAAVTDKATGDGIVWNATGNAIFWKAAPTGFAHAFAIEPVKTLMAEFKLEPGILDGIDDVNMNLLADVTGSSVRSLRSMNLSKDHKVLADLALRVINVVSVFKLAGEKQVTMTELNAAVEGLRLKASEVGDLVEDGAGHKGTLKEIGTAEELSAKDPKIKEAVASFLAQSDVESGEQLGVLVDEKTGNYEADFADAMMFVGSMKKIKAGDEGYVDQDGKPVDPKDMPAARKMAKERREAMESMDDELKRTGRLTNKPVKAERDKVKHELIVNSLDDADASCSAGDWNYSFSGPRSQAEIEQEFRNHSEQHVQAGAITKEFDPKGEQNQPSDKDHMDQLLKDEKRPAVIIDVEPEKDPLKVKPTLYTAKEVSISDLQKNAGKYALAVWCVDMEQAKKQAKWLELRRADYQPLPDHWVPPAGEAAGEGVKEEKDEMNGGKRMVVKEIKTPSSPQAIESTDKVDNTAEQVQKLRQGQVMAAGQTTVSFVKKDNAKGPDDDEVEATVKPASEEIGKVLEAAGYKKVGDGVYAIYKVDQWAAMDAFKKALAQAGVGAVTEEAEHTLVIEPAGVAASAKDDGRPEPDMTSHCYKCGKKKPLYTVQFEFDPSRPNEHICWECMSPRLRHMFTENKTAYDMKAAAKLKAERTEEQQAFEDGITQGENLDSEDVDGADVRVYDNGGETVDRYTIVVENPETGERSWLGSSAEPFHPQGFGQHLGDSVQEGTHLGNKIKFAELPEQVQKFVRSEAEAYKVGGDVMASAGHLMAAPKDPKKKPAKKKAPSKKAEKPAKDETTVGDAVGETPKAEGDDDGAAPAKPKAEAVGGDVNKLIDEKLGKTGEEPAPAAEGDDFKTKARAELAKALGCEPDDLKDEQVYYPIDTVNAVGFSQGSKEYVVFADEDDMETAAKESVRNDFGPNGEGPDLFNQDFIMGHVDREALKSYMSDVFDEWAEGDADELDDKDKEAWLEKQGLMPDNYLDDPDFDVDTLFQANRETWVQEQVTEKLGNDSGQSYWEENLGEEEFRKIIKDNNFIDVESLVDEAVSSDGASHFLNSYDGGYENLPGGMVYMRTN